jgi:transposase-like protein
MGRELGEELSSSNELARDWIRRAARVMAEQMLIQKVDKVLGRVSHQRRDEEAHAAVGYRNADKNRSIRTAQGKLAVEMYARGLSTRDIEDLLKELSDDSDEQTLLSKSAVSRVTEVLWEEFEVFARRDLSSFDVLYLFGDAVYESLRQQAGMQRAKAMIERYGRQLPGAMTCLAEDQEATLWRAVYPDGEKTVGGVHPNASGHGQKGA